MPSAHLTEADFIRLFQTIGPQKMHEQTGQSIRSIYKRRSYLEDKHRRQITAPDGPQFIDYTEDAPVDWRSGFAVLTFRDGKLLQPSTAMVVGENEIDFEREIHRV